MYISLILFFIAIFVCNVPNMRVDAADFDNISETTELDVLLDMSKEECLLPAFENAAKNNRTDCSQQKSLIDLSKDTLKKAKISRSKKNHIQDQMVYACIAICVNKNDFSESYAKQLLGHLKSSDLKKCNEPGDAYVRLSDLNLKKYASGIYSGLVPIDYLFLTIACDFFANEKAFWKLGIKELDQGNFDTAKAYLRSSGSDGREKIQQLEDLESDITEFARRKSFYLVFLKMRKDELLNTIETCEDALREDESEKDDLSKKLFYKKRIEKENSRLDGYDLTINATVKIRQYQTQKKFSIDESVWQKVNTNQLKHVFAALAYNNTKKMVRYSKDHCGFLWLDTRYDAWLKFDGDTVCDVSYDFDNSDWQPLYDAASTSCKAHPFLSGRVGLILYPFNLQSNIPIDDLHKTGKYGETVWKRIINATCVETSTLKRTPRIERYTESFYIDQQDPAVKWELDWIKSKIEETQEKLGDAELALIQHNSKCLREKKNIIDLFKKIKSNDLYKHGCYIVGFYEVKNFNKKELD